MTRIPDGQQGNGERVVAGRYRLLGPLGQGGMGVVWQARDEVLGREVAVKEVRAPAGLDEAEVRRMYTRLEREAWAAARISHRSVVTVFDVVTEDGRPWIVMELVRGLSLAETLEAEGPLSPQRTARIGCEVLAALRSAHEAGVLHRDVKPGNVLIANDGRVVLSDFGIARLEGSSALTMTGEVVGSPEFLAPELALGRDPGPESDLWSLGVLLYAAVEGSSPFRRDTLLSTLRAVVDQELPEPRRAGSLSPVLEGLLRKEPSQRMAAEETERLLRVVAAGGPAHPRTGTGGLMGGPAVMAPHPATEPSIQTAGMAAQPPTTRAQPLPEAREAKRGRATAVLVAGALALVLVFGALAWALWGKSGDDKGGAPVAATSPSGPGNSVQPNAGNTTTGDTAAGDTAVSPSSGTSPSHSTAPAAGYGTTMPAQTVRVHIQAVRDGYTGACPPPGYAAPHFAGTITVGGLPATIEYRWWTRSGRSSAAGWTSYTFPAGGTTSVRVEHTESYHRVGESVHDAMSLQVRGAARGTSGWAEFWVTCEGEEPSSGASPSPSGTQADVSERTEPEGSNGVAEGG
ncbi:protein kinase [Streptomyces sp. NPDC006879]|uniref:serine/threonine-protein kinase n=1 Tax=Streptomyces sp. NPDC006879 TaxID=3364767 RepID=UPI0036990999